MPPTGQKVGFWQKAKKHPQIWLSHHPSCKIFESHTIKIGKHKLCIGCFVGYPAAVIGLILAGTLAKNFETLLFLLIAGLVFYSTQLLSFAKFSDKKGFKILQKSLIGLGSGFLIVFADHVLEPVGPLKWFLVVFFILELGIPVTFLHLRKTTKICENCKEKHAASCPDLVPT